MIQSHTNYLVRLFACACVCMCVRIHTNGEVKAGTCVYVHIYD